MLTYTGILKVKNSEVKVSDKFKKREFVLTDNAASYPQTITFQLSQDRCSLIDKANVGDTLTVTFGLKGREWKNPQGEIKYFNTLDAFRIEAVAVSQAQEPKEGFVENPDSDLPF